jgi:hypothetical protein
MTERTELIQETAFPGLADLASLASAHREWASAHSRLYELRLRTLDSQRSPERLETSAAASLLPAAGHHIDRARALWAVAHGIVDVEIAGGFPPDVDLDAAWAAAVDSFLDG